MAETYQPTGSNIGTLLRLIAEEKTQNATLLPPATTPDSPLREVVQQPLKSSESPGSSRVVSIRPESAAPIGPITPDTSTVVAPVAPPVAPEAPVGPTPVPTPTPVEPKVVAPTAPPTYQAPENISPTVQNQPNSYQLGEKLITPKPVSKQPYAAPSTPQPFAPNSYQLGQKLAVPKPATPTPVPTPKPVSKPAPQPIQPNLLDQLKKTASGIATKIFKFF